MISPGYQPPFAKVATQPPTSRQPPERPAYSEESHARCRYEQRDDRSLPISFLRHRATTDVPSAPRSARPSTSPGRRGPSQLASIGAFDPVLCQNSALLKDHGCNLMHRKVLASFYQHLMAEAPPTMPHIQNVRTMQAKESQRRLPRSPPLLRPAQEDAAEAQATGPHDRRTGAKSATRSSPRSRFEPAVRTPGGPVARHPQLRGRKTALRREIPSTLRGFQGPLSC